MLYLQTPFHLEILKIINIEYILLYIKKIMFNINRCTNHTSYLKQIATSSFINIFTSPLSLTTFYLVAYFHKLSTFWWHSEPSLMEHFLLYV